MGEDQLANGFDTSLGSMPTPPQPPPAPRPRMTSTVEWSDPTPSATPAPAVCEVCRGTPAGDFSFRQTTGMILVWHMETTSGTWCRPCARAIGRKVQNATLLTGWFGLIAFVANLMAVTSNTIELGRAARLADPDDRTRHLDPGRTVLLRWGMALPVAIVALLGWVAVDAARPPSVGDRVAIEDAEIGQCLAQPSGEVWFSLELQDCAGPHDLEVFAVVNDRTFSNATATQREERVWSQCLEAFDTYVGRDHQTSQLDFLYTTSSRDAGNGADQLCLLVSIDGSPLVGSKQDSGE